jgi:hypothetical protein
MLGEQEHKKIEHASIVIDDQYGRRRSDSVRLIAGFNYVAFVHNLVPQRCLANSAVA